LIYFLDSLDTRLGIVWDDISEVVRSANIAGQVKLMLDHELYNEVMVSIHYRLLNLEFEEHSRNEIIRLALLAFTSTLFLQWRNTKSRLEHLATGIKRSLSLLQSTAQAIPPCITLWIYVVGHIAVLDEQEQDTFWPAANAMLNYMELRHWEDIRAHLKSVLWVNAVHDSLVKDTILHKISYQ
jgi:hypothetical protein